MSDKELPARHGNEHLSTPSDRPNLTPDRTIPTALVDKAPDLKPPTIQQVQGPEPAKQHPADTMTPEQLRDSYRKLEQDFGRRSNEIGELRKEIQALKAAQAQALSPEPVPTFDDDPAGAVNARLQPVENQIAELRMEKAKAEIRAKHPDFEQVSAQPEFADWVKEKKHRVLLALSANSGDSESAVELFDQYNEFLQGNVPTNTALERNRLVRQMGAERGSSVTPVGQVYSRAELINLRAMNPRRYQEMLPSITAAYREGRVTD